jgi:hypothetical protein
LGLPVGVGKSRALIQELLVDLNDNVTLPDSERNALIGLARAQQVILAQRMPASQAIIANQGATTAAQQIRTKMQAGVDLRGAALKQYETVREQHNSQVFNPLAAALEKIGARRDTLDIVKAFDDLTASAFADIRSATTTDDANRLAAEYKVAADQMAVTARSGQAEITGKLEGIKTRAANEAKFQEKLAQIAEDLTVFEVTFGNPDSQQRDTLKTLTANYAPKESDLVAGLREADELAALIAQAIKQADTAATQKLLPLRQELARLKEREVTLQAEKSTSSLGGLRKQAFKGLEATWKQIDAKIALVERSLKDSMPITGVPFVQGVIDEIKAMLTTAESFLPSDNDEMAKALEALEKLTKSSSFLFFDTDLKKYLPNDAQVLKVQFDSIDADSAKMTPKQTVAHVNALREAAEIANRRAAALKSLCETATAKLDEGKTIINALNDIVKNAPAQNAGVTKFAGPFKKTVADLQTALAFDGTGPDEGSIRSLMARFDDQAAEFLTGKQISISNVMRTHQAGAAEDALAKVEKDKVDAKKKAASELLKATEKALAAVNPSDQNELAVLKRQLGEANAASDKVPPESALQRYDALIVRIQRLQDEPGGAAVSARGNLSRARDRFISALSAATKNLSDLAGTIASDYEGPAKGDLTALVTRSLKQIDLPKKQILDGIQGFFDNAEPQMQPGRLKAREVGLTGVRMYRTVLASDPVLVKLAASSAFANDGLGPLAAALGDLELNLLRSI